MLVNIVQTIIQNNDPGPPSINAVVTPKIFPAPIGSWNVGGI